MKKENNALYILRLAVTLLAICAAVALALAGVNAITEDRIAAIQVIRSLPMGKRKVSTATVPIKATGILKLTTLRIKR